MPKADTAFLVDPIVIANGSDIPWNRWPGRTAAGRVIGCSPLEFRRLIQEGAVKEYKAPDESRRYNPEELDELAEQWASKESDETTVGGKPIEGMRAASDLLKQSQGHVERVLNVAITGFEKTLSAMNAIVERLAADNQQLSKIIQDGATARQQAEALQLEAAVEAETRISAERRREQLVAALLPHVGPVLGRIAEAVGASLPGGSKQEAEQDPDTMSDAAQTALPPAVTIEQKAYELLRRIGPDKLHLAKTLLDDEDQPLADELLEELKGTEQPCAHSTDPPSTKTEPPLP